MTCIAGLEQNGRVYIGGDSAGVAGASLSVRANPKVFHNGPFLIGFTTSFRMGQLLQFKLSPPPHPNGVDTLDFLVCDFVDAVRRCLTLGGFAKRREDQEVAGAFLLGYRGGLYTIDSDYQVAKATDGFASVGAGSQTALGALYALEVAMSTEANHLSKPTTANGLAILANARANYSIQKPISAGFTTDKQLTPEERIIIALHAAERSNSTVRAPFIVLSND